MPTILIADDDRDLTDVLAYALAKQGYSVVAATTADRALQRLSADRPELVLLDINLPNVNGFELCRRIRMESNIPIIMLTARREESDILQAFRLGADDFVSKPFSTKQLTARIQAILRRASPDPYAKPMTRIRVGDLVLDTDTYEVTKAGRRARLTPIEFRILFVLAMNAGRLVPYHRIVEHVWQYDVDAEGRDANLLKSHISHIRAKLQLSETDKDGIRAVVGVGYMLARPTGGRASNSPTADLSA
jgi:DNA-binding response OmpR family regulator